MPRYRKKPVVIEAFQMTRERRTDNSEWPEWLDFAWQKERGEPGALQIANIAHLATEPSMVEIVTLEGNHLVSWDDFIIQGVAGELYPCKPDIFAATYESIPPDEEPGPEPKCKTCNDKGWYSVPSTYTCDHGESPAMEA